MWCKKPSVGIKTRSIKLKKQKRNNGGENKRPISSETLTREMVKGENIQV